MLGAHTRGTRSVLGWWVRFWTLEAWVKCHLGSLQPQLAHVSRNENEKKHHACLLYGSPDALLLLPSPMARGGAGDIPGNDSVAGGDNGPLESGNLSPPSGSFIDKARGRFGGSGNALDTRFFAFSTTQWSYKTHRNTLGPMP